MAHPANLGLLHAQKLAEIFSELTFSYDAMANRLTVSHVKSGLTVHSPTFSKEPKELVEMLLRAIFERTVRAL